MRPQVDHVVSAEPAVGFGRANPAPARTRFLVLCGGLAILAGMAPLLVGPVLQDWPSHVARVHILQQMLADPGAFWTRYYTLGSFFLPNLVLDAALLGLLKLGIGIGAAATLFLLATYGVFLAGFARLSAACGAFGPLTLPLAVLTFYSGAFFFGLVNYVFGVGLMLFLVGAWLGAERWAARMAIAVLGAVALFFCHLIPALLYAGILGCLELYALATRRTHLLRVTSPVALAVLGVLLALSPSSDDAFGIAYVGSAPLEFARWKASLFVKALLGGAFASDLVLAGLGLLAVIAVLLTCRLAVPPAMALAIAALVLLTLAAPQRVGLGSLFDYRVALVPIVVLLATVRITPRRPGRVPWAAIAVTACAVVRSATLAAVWHQDRVAVIEPLDRALAQLPRESILLAAFGRDDTQLSWREYWSPALSNIPAIAAMHDVFVLTVFAHATQQPLALKPEWQPWNLAPRTDTPARFQEVAGKAAAMCGGGRPVSLLLIYPESVLRSGPPPAASGPHFALLRYC